MAGEGCQEGEGGEGGAAGGEVGQGSSPHQRGGNIFEYCLQIISKTTIENLSRSPNQERRKRPSSADAVRRRPFSVMSFEPRVETRSLEASYNLTAQLRLEMMERRREEEVRGKTKHEIIISPLKVRAKGRKEKEEKEKEERGRRRRLNNPVWENIKAEIEVFSSSKFFFFF